MATREDLRRQLADLEYMVGEGEWERAEAHWNDYAEAVERLLDANPPGIGAHDQLTWREACDIMADGLCCRSRQRFRRGARLVAAIASDRVYEASWA